MWETKLRAASSESLSLNNLERDSPLRYEVSRALTEVFIRVGDRVGVGAQSSSCLRPDCEECANGLENHCGNPGYAGTYDGVYPDGSKSYGGYSDYARVPSHFVIKIPDEIPSEEAAPMLCGGITVYSPLKNNGAGPGKNIGIVGIGGLGHFGLLYAKVFRAFTTCFANR